MSNPRNILLIDNDAMYIETVSEWLTLNNYSVHTAFSLTDAKNILETTPIQLIITDLRVIDDSDSQDISGLFFVRSVAPTIPKIIMTGYASYDIVREAMRIDPNIDGPAVVDFVLKSEGLEKLVITVGKIFETYLPTNYPQFKVGGALTDDNAAIYITRQAERQIIDSLVKMEYLLIIEPRQQGKTSLINFLIRYPEVSKPILVYIDISAIDRLSQVNWYQSLSERIVDQLDQVCPGQIKVITPNNHAQWRSMLSTLARFFKEIQKNLIIALDEVGTPIPDAIGFFSVLRDIYNSRQAEPYFKHLTFLLVGAFDPRDLIEDDRYSPFNVAHRIRLHDFSLEQVWRLVSTFSSIETQVDIIAARIYYWTSGQPYLTQQLCSYLRLDSTPTDIDITVDRLRREDENHFPPLLKQINNDINLRSYIERIINGEHIKFYPSENHLQAQLELLGIIKPDINGYCILRNRIYELLMTSSNNVSVLHKEHKAVDVQSKNISSAQVKENQINKKQTTILFLAADPSDASRLRLGQELREIQEKLQMAELRNKFVLRQRLSVRPVDITQAILDEKPQIVHFSGHGTNDGELCFEDEVGKSKPVEPDALGALFELISSQVDCVMMNVCYSTIQADSIAKHIKYVIGMSGGIGDKAAISFSIGFYQALGAGKSIEESYKFGCIQIRLQGIPEHFTPILNMKKSA